MKINNIACLIQNNKQIISEILLRDALANLFYKEKINVSDNMTIIQNKYRRLYKISIPKQNLEKNINKYFITKGNAYELKEAPVITIKEINRQFETMVKEYETNYRGLENIFKTFVHDINRNIKKEDAKSLFRNVMEKYSANQEYNNQEYEVGEAPDSYRNNIIITLFLRKLMREQNQYMDFLEKVFLSNSIVSTKEINEDSFANCHIFVDTPILLQYFGYDGKDYSQYYKSLFETLKAKKVSIKIFLHTFEECAGILYALQSAYNQKNFAAKGLIEYLSARKELGDSADDSIPLNIDGFKRLLDKKKICIQEKAEYTKENVIYDENKLMLEFKKKYGVVQRAYPDRIKNDCLSIYAIQALRLQNNIKDDDKNIQSYSDAKFYLLTNNKGFVKIAQNNYCGQEKKYSEILFIDDLANVVFQNEENGLCIQKNLFYIRSVTGNVFSENFSSEFFRLVNRLERINQKIDLISMLEKHPEYIQDAAELYEAENRSIKAVEDFLFEKAGYKSDTVEYDNHITLEKTCKEGNSIDSADNCRKNNDGTENNDFEKIAKEALDGKTFFQKLIFLLRILFCKHDSLNKQNHNN